MGRCHTDTEPKKISVGPHLEHVPIRQPTPTLWTGVAGPPTAAAVAREIAFDESAPWHVRLRAARRLALLSEPYRADARKLLTSLRRGDGSCRDSTTTG